VLSQPPPGLRAAAVLAKQLEYELETAWKKMNERLAQSEGAYLRFAKAHAHTAFMEWQSAQSEYAAARAEYDRINQAFEEASRVAVVDSIKAHVPESSAQARRPTEPKG
jgi:hypothetical protein